jgi:hypothetical protein
MILIAEPRALRGFRVVLAVLVTLCLALAVLVWAQLLQGLP